MRQLEFPFPLPPHPPVCFPLLTRGLWPRAALAASSSWNSTWFEAGAQPTVHASAAFTWLVFVVTSTFPS